MMNTIAPRPAPPHRANVLPGPSRTITVEPLTVPAPPVPAPRVPAPDFVPSPERPPDREPVPTP